MTKQFVQNNTIFVVEYGESVRMKTQNVYGYKIQQLDSSILWNFIVGVHPSFIQNSNALQKLVNQFYNQTEYGWEEYLDKLVKDGELQDVPQIFYG